jgi:hypothetical protein
MLRAQRRRETVTEGGWADLPDELMAKVLEMLQAAGWTEPQTGGFGFSEASATVRLVSAGWKAVHDALVTRLVLRRQTIDEAVGILVRRFPAVVSLEFKGEERRVLTDEGLRAVNNLPALTSLSLRCCREVTAEGLRAVSNIDTPVPAEAEADLRGCMQARALPSRRLKSRPLIS